MKISPDLPLYLSLRIRGFKSHFVRTELCRWHYVERKHPQSRGTLVFLHGIGASLAHYHEVLAGLFDQGYSIFAPDLPLHGLSSEPLGSLNAESLRLSFKEWVNRVHPDPFVLIGNSLGGAVSLRFALEYPNQVQKLILISPAGGFSSQEEWEEFRKCLLISTLKESRSYVDRIFHKRPFYAPIVYYPFLKFITQKKIKELLESTRYEDFQVDPKLYAKLPPTLMIWGKSEGVFPREHLSWFRGRLPKHVVFDESEEVGHCPQLDNPQWLISRIKTFLED